MTIHSMWDYYPSMQEDLQAVLHIIEDNVRIRDKQIEQTIKEMIYSGGKLLRPAYTLFCAHIGPDFDQEQARSVAAALEILHMATLVHDDVIDEADTRRGKPTISAKYGTKYAIYTGDYLFAVCFKILSQYSHSLQDIAFSTKSMEKVLLGELAQMNTRYNIDKTVRQYLSQISGKTAQLFGLACYSGAVISNSSNIQKRNAWNIGRNIGMAFQIMDDILDYTQDNLSLGKPVLNDVQQGVYSLPLLFALKKKKAILHPLLEKRENMTQADLQEVLHLVHAAEGVQAAHQVATKYTNKALQLIEQLPDSAYRQEMTEVTKTLLQREV